MNLDKIFNPKSIAVVGASGREGSVGYALFKNLKSGYRGAVYPVNIKRRSVQGVKAYKSVKDTPNKVDLAVIATPAWTVPGIISECGQAGVGATVIISAGFAETGRPGEALAKKVFSLAKKHKMRVLGPNCLGFIRPALNLNASFASKTALPGKIAFISQSGALCTAILDWSVKNNVGFSYFVSVGSMLDVGFHDLIDYFSSNEDVSSILIYMESLSEARRFLSAARAFSRTKPILVLKSGRSSEGARAAKSHTGGLAGNDEIFDAAFERAGVIRVDTILDLFHGAKALAMQPKPLGDRLAVVTNAGGPGVIATDSLIYSHGRIAALAHKTIAKLDLCLPAAWSRGNPVDILGDADAHRYKKAIAACLDDGNVDAVLAILTPQAMTDPAAVAKELAALPNKWGKTILAAWMGGDDVAVGRAVLEKGNVPVYRTPEDAVRCFMNIASYAKRLETLYQTPATIPHAFAPDTEKNKRLLLKVISEKRLALTEAEAKEFLANYDIPVVKYFVAKSADEAGEAAAKIGFPVVMKISSSDILHKSDIGGVLLNINSKQEARSAFIKIMENARKHEPQAKLDGVFIEAQVKKRYELIIGSKKDPIFGPAIVFGLGGLAVEIFKDAKVGLPPLNMALAMRMIEGTKIYKLLKGYRNVPGVDIASIQFLLYKFAYLVSDFPEIKEIDINPFGVDEYGGIVLDAKAILDEKVIGKGARPYSHLVISPYPKEYMYDFVLKNGQKAQIRPIKPEDEEMEIKMVDGFSRETQKQRFFKELGEVNHDFIVRFTQIDYDREIALIAELTEEKPRKMAGVTRIIAEPDNETAEFTIAIADEWQGLGLGSRFTDIMLKVAKKRGIKKIYAKYLKDNKRMERIFSKRGFKIEEIEGIMRAEKKL